MQSQTDLPEYTPPVPPAWSNADTCIAFFSRSPSEKAHSFIHRLQAMAAIRPIRNRNRFLSWSAPDPLSTAQTSLPSSLSTITTRLHDPVSHVRIPSRLHSIPTPTPISLRLDLFGRLIARPRNVHVHSEAVHVHVHDDAACTCTSTCTCTRGGQSVRSLSKSKSESESIPVLVGTRPSQHRSNFTAKFAQHHHNTVARPGFSCPNPIPPPFDSDTAPDPELVSPSIFPNRIWEASRRGRGDLFDLAVGLGWVHALIQPFFREGWVSFTCCPRQLQKFPLLPIPSSAPLRLCASPPHPHPASRARSR